MPVAEGRTYKEAMKRGQNALEHLVEVFSEQGTPLPQPQVYAAKE